MAVAKLITSAGQTQRTALEFAVASERFATFQLGQISLHLDQENPRITFAQYIEQFLTPVGILNKVIDDEVGAQFEMGAPAALKATEQTAHMRIENNAKPRAAAVPAGRVALVQILPTRASVMWTA